MDKCKWLLSVLLFVLCLSPLPGHAIILFHEDWEGTPASITNTWADTNCASGSFPLTSDPSLSTDRAISGTHSIKFVYTGHQQDHINAGFTGPGTLGLNVISVPCTTTSAYFTPTQEIWLTWYEYIVSGFQFDEISTKEWYVYGSTSFGNQVGGWPNLYNTFGNGANSPATGSPLGLSFQGVFDSTGSPWGTYNQQGTVTTVYDKWICYEQHYKMNDVGVANGVLQIYVTNITDNGPTVLSLDAQNHQWRGTNLTDPWPSNSLWGSIKLFVQDAIGVMYRDNITVSTTRIGCSGSTADTTPPAPTATFTVSPGTGSTVNFVWAACTDFSGIGGYNLRRALGAVQPVSPPLLTFGGGVTSGTDNTTAAGTTYSYDLNCFDTAGNQSTYFTPFQTITTFAPPPPSPPSAPTGLSVQ